MHPTTCIQCEDNVNQIKVLVEKALEDEFGECLAFLTVAHYPEGGEAYKIQFTLDSDEDQINTIWLADVCVYTMDELNVHSG